jgi:hypothetical protein
MSASYSCVRMKLLVTGVSTKKITVMMSASRGSPAGSSTPRTPQVAPHRLSA